MFHPVTRVSFLHFLDLRILLLILKFNVPIIIILLAYLLKLLFYLLLVLFLTHACFLLNIVEIKHKSDLFVFLFHLFVIYLLILILHIIAWVICQLKSIVRYVDVNNLVEHNFIKFPDVNLVMRADDLGPSRLIQIRMDKPVTLLRQ